MEEVDRPSKLIEDSLENKECEVDPTIHPDSQVISNKVEVTSDGYFTDDKEPIGSGYTLDGETSNLSNKSNTSIDPQKKETKGSHKKVEVKSKQKEKKPSLFSRIFGKRKKESQSTETEKKAKGREVFIVDSVDNLPDEWRKKIHKLNINIKTEDQLKILLTILQFMTKDIYKMSEHVHQRRDRRPYEDRKSVV